MYRKETSSVVMSVRPDETNPLQLDGYSLNLIFEGFSKLCHENSNFIKNLARITDTLHENLRKFIIISRYIIIQGYS